MSVVIHAPRYRDAYTKAPSIGMNGRFHVELIHAATGLVKQKFTTENIITTAGLNAFLGTSGASTLDTLLTFMAVGTNNTAPAIGDSALGAQVGTRSNFNGGVSDVQFTETASPEYVMQQRTREFDTTNANGNLTEVGFFSAASGGVMWCRALFKDSGGTPITVVKTATDTLRITYELRIYPALGDTTQTAINISGTNYDFVWRPVTRTLWPINQWSGGLPGIARVGGAQILTRTTQLTRWGTDFDTGTNSDGTPTIAYNSGLIRYERTHIWTASIGALTIGSIQIATFQNVAGQRTQYLGTVNPTMPKTAANQLTLNFTQDFVRI